MSIGQIAVQLPFGSVAEKPAPVPAEPIHAENRVVKARQFESVMRKVAQHETAHAEPKPHQAAKTVAAESGDKSEQQTASRTTVEREPQHAASAGEKAEPTESAVPQKEKVAAVEAQLPEVEIPQNVVISTIGMQTVPLVQLDGRMPELQTATPQTVSAIAAANAAEAVVTALPGVAPLQELAAEPVQPQPEQQLQSTPVAVATQVPTAELNMPEAKPVQTQAAEAAPVVVTQGDTIRLAAKPDQPTPEVSSVVLPAAPAQKVSTPSSAVTNSEDNKTVAFTDLASSPKQVEPGQKPEQATGLETRPSAAKVVQPVEASPEAIRAAVVPSAENSAKQSTLAAPVVVETTVTPQQPDMVAEAPVVATTTPVVEPVERAVTPLTNRPEPVQAGQNTAAIKVVTNSTAADATVQAAENTQKPAGAATVAPVTQSNRTESVLDAYYQTAPRPSAVAVPVTEPVASTDQVLVAAATPAATETQATSPAASGENTRAIAADDLANRPVATTVAAPVIPATPVAEVLPEPVAATPGTQAVSSASRVTVVPMRNPEKNVREIGQELQIKESDNQVSEQHIASAVVSLEAAASLDSGQNFAGSENSAGQNLNGQAHLMAAQQHKTEQASSISAPATRDVREPVTAEPMEQHVVQQVKDHLTGRDFKTGTEQVTIRLTPENMGELKLNLKMENQQIKIEIVAEKSMVRDALIKHSESLRETLAKQNITMESFNVSTGGNGNQSGRNQNDWRELELQRQQNAWMASGGYRTPEQAAPSLAAVYQARPEHAMVDLHF
jgi:flagellar hook-length control protein FliK